MEASDWENPDLDALSVMLSSHQDIPGPSVTIALNIGEHDRPLRLPGECHWTLALGSAEGGTVAVLPRRSILLFQSLDSRD